MRFWPNSDGLHRQLDELRERNAQLHAENGQMRATIDDLRERVASLQQQIIDDNHAIIDHFAVRATASRVFGSEPVQAMPIKQPDPRPTIDEIAKSATRTFYQTHKIAGYGVPLSDQKPPADTAHDET